MREFILISSFKSSFNEEQEMYTMLPWLYCSQKFAGIRLLLAKQLWLKSIKIFINSYIMTSQQLHLLRNKLLVTKTTRKVFMYTNIHLSNLRILLLVNYINLNATLLRSMSYTHFITWKFRLRLEEVQWQKPAPSDRV